MILVRPIGSAIRMTVAAAGVAAAGAAPALAVSTTLSGSVSTNTPGTLVQQSFFDVRSATLTGLSTGDAVGNASTADGQLLAPTGIFVLTAGARSGGGVGTGGQANAQSHCDTTQTYVITSATLPPGTLVPVTIGWSLDANAYAAGNLTHYLSTASGEVDGHVQVTVSGSVAMNKTGIYRRAYDTTSGGYNVVSGTLNMLGDFGIVTANVPVGQTVQLSMDMTANAVTTAVLQSTTGADAEIAVLWGVSVTGADAAAVLQSNPSELAPPAANATPANAALALPPRPSGSLDCLAFSAQPEPLTRCIFGEASFSVVATGTGPFTYQWRRNGVPLSSALNPSAATSSLSLNSVASEDAGAYDCVVTNNCGGVASTPATLTILPSCCPADLDNGTGTGARDGGVDINDLLFFLAAFEAGSTPADLDNGSGSGTPDGGVDINDLLFFLTHFEAGC